MISESDRVAAGQAVLGPVFMTVQEAADLTKEAQPCIP
jgi:hypothetical protein